MAKKTTAKEKPAVKKAAKEINSSEINEVVKQLTLDLGKGWKEHQQTKEPKDIKQHVLNHLDSQPEFELGVGYGSEGTIVTLEFPNGMHCIGIFNNRKEKDPVTVKWSGVKIETVNEEESE